MIDTREALYTSLHYGKHSSDTVRNPGPYKGRHRYADHEWWKYVAVRYGDHPVFLRLSKEYTR